jgi:hypothetical protein
MHTPGYYSSPDPEHLYKHFCQNGGSELIRTVSRNFKIKVYGEDLNKLVGVFGLLELTGSETCLELIRSAFRSSKDIYTVNLRRGLKVTFYSI